MLALKLVQIGNSLGFVLPKEAQAKMKVAKGDMEEDASAAWIRDRLAPISGPSTP